MNRLSAHQSLAILNDLREVDEYFNAIGRIVPACEALVRNGKRRLSDACVTLLRASLSDVEIEPATPAEGGS
jgi:hypothetical protein